MAETYSDQYKEQAFALWYDGNRKISQKFANSLPEDEKGQRPTFKTIEKWRDDFGWMQRADALDGELSRRLQDEVINKRIRMYEEHVEVSNALILKGKEYLDTHSIEDMGDAIKAISLGVEIQRVSVGQIELGQKILRMSDEQLNKEIYRLMGKSDELEDSEIIDVPAEEEG